MTSNTTSPAPAMAGPGALPARHQPATSARDEWARYAAFLRRPRLPDGPSATGGAGLLATMRMLGLDLMVMIVLVSIAGLVLLTGFEFPDNEVSSLKWSAGIIALVVLGAPIMEELAFRSWLSGRPGHVLAFLFTATGLGAVGFANAHPDDASMTGVAVLAGCVVLAALALWLLRGRPPMRWFAFLFPLFFVIATVGFALVHLLNYTEGTLMMLLPLVLPQLITGSMLGYVRVHYGLWAAMLLHILHNGALVGVVLLATQLGAA